MELRQSYDPLAKTSLPQRLSLAYTLYEYIYGRGNKGKGT